MKMICAVDENWGIGKDNKLLCYIPSDLRHFKKVTMGSKVLMGRKTYDSLPNKPLPNRENIVITRNRDYKPSGVTVIHSLTELNKMDTSDMFVIGGGEIYNKLIPYCDELFITKIHKSFEVDTTIKNLDEMKSMEVSKLSEIIKENGIKFQFLKYTNHDVKSLDELK